MLLTLEITRRTTGWPLVCVAVVALIYMFLGDKLPRAIMHNGFTLDQIVEYLFLQGDGIYGVPIQTAANTLFAFIMFGAFLDNSKMGNIFMDIACLLTKKAQGGRRRSPFLPAACSAPLRAARLQTFTQRGRSPFR